VALCWLCRLVADTRKDYGLDHDFGVVFSASLLRSRAGEEREEATWHVEGLSDRGVVVWLCAEEEEKGIERRKGGARRGETRRRSRVVKQ